MRKTEGRKTIVWLFIYNSKWMGAIKQKRKERKIDKKLTVSRTSTHTDIFDV